MARMSKDVAELMAAKEAVLETTKDEAWLKSVGLGLVNGGPGLVVSVAPRATARAKQVLDKEHLEVPCRIREIGPIRTRQKK